MNIPQPSRNLQKLIEKIKEKKRESCTHQFNLLDELHANENAHTRIFVRLLQIPSLLHSFLVYLKDNFLMIRDSDGKDHEMLKRQLCQYYEERNRQDANGLARVTRKNVLILKM